LGGRYLAGIFASYNSPDFCSEFEIGMEFIPTVRATHEHSPNICRDTKRLITSFAIFDYVTFHRYCIGRETEIIKQDDRDSPGWASVPKIEVPLDVVLTFWLV
jgi:hypothetical protein